MSTIFYKEGQVSNSLNGCSVICSREWKSDVISVIGMCISSCGLTSSLPVEPAEMAEWILSVLGKFTFYMN